MSGFPPGVRRFCIIFRGPQALNVRVEKPGTERSRGLKTKGLGARTRNGLTAGFFTSFCGPKDLRFLRDCARKKWPLRVTTTGVSSQILQFGILLTCVYRFPDHGDKTKSRP